MDIDKAVSYMYNRHLSDIFSGCRKGKMPEARYLIWYLHNTINKTSSIKLESIYGWDDASIRYGIRRIKVRLKKSQGFRERVLGLEYKLKNS